MLTLPVLGLVSFCSLTLLPTHPLGLAYADDVLSNTANIASLLWHAYKSLPEPSSHVNWAGTSSSFPSLAHTAAHAMPPGFYTLDRSDPSGKSLILGPFQGKIACQAIAFGRGVCGTAAQTQKTQLVPNVEEFPGHIACDSESKSEIVVPITVDDPNNEGGRKVVAIIDVDCAVENGFDEVDAKYLGELAELLARSCDW